MEKQYIADVIAQQTKNPTVTGFISEMGEINTGDNFRVRNVTLTDKSGSIQLALWNDEIERVKQGQYYTIENGWLREYDGKPQLHVGKYGKLLQTDESQMLPAREGQTKLEEPMTNLSNNNFSIPEYVYAEAKTSCEKYHSMMKQLGCESPEGMAAVWNTIIMRYRK